MKFRTKLFIIQGFSIVGMVIIANAEVPCAAKTQDGIRIGSKAQEIQVNSSFSGKACVISEYSILYRGDSRKTDEIFKNGFTLKDASYEELTKIKTQQAWEDMLGVYSGGFTDNGVSTALTMDTAETYTSLDCVYVIDSKGLTPISVEATVNYYNQNTQNLGDEVLFIKNIPNSKIMGCKQKNSGTLIKNPYYQSY